MDVSYLQSIDFDKDGFKQYKLDVNVERGAAGFLILPVIFIVLIVYYYVYHINSGVERYFVLAILSAIGILISVIEFFGVKKLHQEMEKKYYMNLHIPYLLTAIVFILPVYLLLIAMGIIGNEVGIVIGGFAFGIMLPIVSEKVIGIIVSIGMVFGVWLNSVYGSMPMETLAIIIIPISFFILFAVLQHIGREKDFHIIQQLHEEIQGKMNYATSSENFDQITGFYNKKTIFDMVTNIWKSHYNKKVKMSMGLLRIERYVFLKEKYGEKSTNMMMQTVAKTLTVYCNKLLDISECHIGHLSEDVLLIVVDDMEEEVFEKVFFEIQESVEGLHILMMEKAAPVIKITLRCSTATFVPSKTNRILAVLAKLEEEIHTKPND